MKRTYQIDERKAIEKFRSYLVTNPGSIQMVLPLAEVAQRLREGVSQMLFQTERDLLSLIMVNEATWLSSLGGERWGTAPGAVVIHGQKVPVDRPRVRQENRDIKLGSYELFREDDVMQRQVWDKIMRGLTMRGYGPSVRACAPAFGINKSAVSDRFIAASGKQVEDLRKRKLSKLRLCALLMDGVEYRGEHFVVALGIDETGSKTVLGFHQGASENQQICDRLLDDLAARGLDMQQGFLAVLDGGRGLRASMKKHCGDNVLVQRCQLHKRRNISEHFADEQQSYWDRKLANAYDLMTYAEAKRCLQQIQRELQQNNPSAARSLEEGLEETLTLHRLGVPAELRTSLRTTNPIESAFSRVRTVCRNVKRWRPGDQRERWIGSGLIFAEQKFRRIVGYRALPKLITLLKAQRGVKKPANRVA
jgi:putative transposase